MDQCGEDKEQPVSMETSDHSSGPEPEPGPGHKPSCVSLKSDQSRDIGVTFKGRPSQRSKRTLHVPDLADSGPSCLSYKSDRSKGIGVTFGKKTKLTAQSPELLEDDWTRKRHSNPRKRPPYEDPMIDLEDGSHLDSIFMRLEDQVVSYVKDELKQMKMVLSSRSADDSESLREDEDEVQRKSTREACLQLTLYFLRRMEQGSLANLLQSNSQAITCKKKLQSRLKKESECLFEGIAQAGNPTRLKEIYTEQDITEGEAGEVNYEHEVGQIERAHRKQDRPGKKIHQEQLFKPLTAGMAPFRLVMTKGVAGIGKTVLTQKFTLDWCEGNDHGDINFLFPFNFRELNVVKDKKLSLVGLVHRFFPETKEAGIYKFEGLQVLFILNGLDECRLPLRFAENETVTDTEQPISLDVLLTNLIKGNLFPSARIWITTRPAAANQIPSQYVNRVTEVRGFTDDQKEEYFKKKFQDNQTSRIISHFKRFQTFHILCHIPVFCWITAAVTKEVLKNTDEGELPKTLTEMYIHFLVLQTRMKKVKYDGEAPTDSLWTSQSIRVIESLGKLAFQQLLKGNLIFYESDLKECGIDIKAASVYSGLFTQIFREQTGVSKGQVFSFIHLSFQEFLAALHVHLTFTSYGANMLKEEKPPSRKLKTKVDVTTQIQFYQSAVDKALQDPNGHLDLFLRFLLGLSLQTNQILLYGLMPQTGSNALTNQETVQYIKTRMTANLPPEKSTNLFHCLNELNDRTLEKEVRQNLESGRFASDAPSSAQWSALAFILLSSKEPLDKFDLKKYSSSEEALSRLLSVVKASDEALLSGCNLSVKSCEHLSSILSSPSCSLKVLDLSNNDLMDSGVELLSAGLKSPNCQLEVLRLSGCLITNKGGEFLASALTTDPSLPPRPLRELDLRYNHIRPAGVKLLCNVVKALRVENNEAKCLTPGLKKYFCELRLDTDTVNKYIQLSANNKEATHVEQDQLYPDRPDRFDYYPQLLCRDALQGRCYWEVEWSGTAHVSVSYQDIRRKGNRAEGAFGGSDESWSLSCSDDGFAVCHKDTKIPIASHSTSSSASSPSVSRRVAVYVDCPAGILSFYRVSAGTLIHLHTFSTTFTEPLYPGFRFGYEFRSGSSLALCSP